MEQQKLLSAVQLITSAALHTHIAAPQRKEELHPTHSELQRAVSTCSLVSIGYMIDQLHCPGVMKVG